MVAKGDRLRWAEEVVARRRTRWMGCALRASVSVGSTNAEAAAWAAQGAEAGSIVLAEYQTAGRGRHGRTWTAQAGQNLTFSVVLRPPLAPPQLGLVTMAASLAVSEVIEAFAAPYRAAVKWPNDILLDGRKCCGMLLESSIGRQAGSQDAARVDYVILGVGLNVNQAAFPPELEAATSILLASGRHVARSDLWEALLEALERRYDEACSEDVAALRGAYEARLEGRGEHISLHATDGACVAGRFLGVDSVGGLVLDTSGQRRTFYAGDVSTRPIGA